MNHGGPPSRQPPIVPSKNALRALRRLAFSPSALVISTIGSACGIASLNHEVNRRVHLAEKSLETKRVIRSLSHGRGAAQITAMIEAAERGEDFTSSKRRPNKRKRKETSARSFSAVASQDHAEHAYDSGPGTAPPQPEAQHVPLFRKVVSYRSMPPPGEPPQPVAARTSGIHSNAVLRILQASRWHRKPPDPRVYSRPSTRRQQEVDRGENLLRQWIKPPDNTSDPPITDSAASPSPTQVSRSPAEAPFTSVAAKTDIDEDLQTLQTHGTALSTFQTVATQVHWTPSAPESLSDPLLPQAGLHSVDEPPWASTSDAKIDEPMRSTHRHLSQSHSPAQADLEPPSQAPVNHGAVYGREEFPSVLLGYLDDELMDQHLRDHVNASKTSNHTSPQLEVLLLGTPKGFVRHARETMDADKFSSICEFINPTLEGRDKPPSFRKWLAAMRYLTRQHNPPDWTVAEALVYEFRHQLGPAYLNVPPVFDLIQHLLATVPTSRRVQELLFPTAPDATMNRTRRFTLSVRYLQFFCESLHSASEYSFELSRIIDVAKRCKLNPSPSLFIPVLRALIRSKDFELATTVLERLTVELTPAESLALVEEYTILNACEGNWAVVEAMLDKFHDMNQSRNLPIDSGRLFDRILQRHSTKNPSDRTFDFTIHAMKYAGLVPTTRVSRTLVCSCIRDGRYDLVAEWLRLLREAYPRASLGFDLLQGGWLLADSLSDNGLSCEEIAKTCQAIAHGFRRDRFGPGFREFAVDLVKSDLRSRIRALSTHISIEMPSEDIRLMPMERLLKYVNELYAAPTPEGSNAVTVEGLKNDLAIQISAIADLAKTFRGDVKKVFFDVKNQQDMLPQSRRTVLHDPHLNSGDAVDRILFDHQWKSSDGIGRLKTALAEHYSQRQQQGLPADHTLLKHFVTRVGPEYPSEVLELVEAIYEYDIQQEDGPQFDTDLLKRWLYLVSIQGSKKSAKAALTAVVDLEDRVEWTAHFRHLCEFVTQLGTVDNEALWDERRFAQKPESGKLKFVYQKIKRRWLGRSVRETFKFPEWKGYEIDWSVDSSHNPS